VGLSAPPLGAGYRLFSPSKDPFLQQRGRGGRASGRVLQLDQWLCLLGMNPPQPVLAGGPVGTAVPGWLASALPPERSLARTQLRQDVRQAERSNGTIPGTRELRESLPRLFLATGGVGTAVRCYLVSVPPLRRGLWLEPSRGKTGGQRGAGTALPEALPSFETVNDVPVGLSGGLGGACCVQDYVQHHVELSEPSTENSCHPQQIFVLQPMNFGDAIDSMGVNDHGPRFLSSRPCRKGLISVQF
jgi:hypothetical protein